MKTFSNYLVFGVVWQQQRATSNEQRATVVMMMIAVAIMSQQPLQKMVHSSFSVAFD
jgi:hypothetical protein